MALTKLRDYDPSVDDPWIMVMPSIERLDTTRVIIQVDDGSACQGYASKDGKTLWPGPLITPSPAKMAADTAANVAEKSAMNTRQTQAKQTAAVLSTLDNGTASNAQVQTILADMIRFIGFPLPAHKAPDR